ncbi:DUF4386 domain-containing protein [Nonomuraea sp. NPDC050202]|uniref:DUF4386 domain-containing protein n=1 Tax=Nonomuraea sp. NPDC050202 TaxID=3155035 RepID=UPI0034055AF2
MDAMRRTALVAGLLYLITIVTSLPALGFVAARVLEAAIIVAGITSLLAVVTLRQAAAAGADTDSLITTGTALVAIHNGTFLLGPGFIPAVNALLLGSLLYRARLVPRVIPVLGLIGAPLLLLSAAAVLFGLHPQVSVLSAMSAVPIFLWEGSLGLWLVVKGFKPSPLTAATGRS